MTHSLGHPIGQFLLIYSFFLSLLDVINGGRMAPEVAVCETNKDNPYDTKVSYPHSIL